MKGMSIADVIRWLVLGCVITGFVSMSGCAAGRPGQGYSDDTPDEIERLIKHDFPEALYAVGTATGPEEGVAQRKATMQARAEIARVFKTHVDALQRSYEETVGDDGAQEYQQTIESFAALELKGSKVAKSVVRRERDGTWTSKVLVVLSAEEFKAMVDQKMKDYTSFRASQAYKDLEARVKREKQM